MEKKTELITNRDGSIFHLSLLPGDISNKIINRLDNVLAFYELYRDKDLEGQKNISSVNILDRWINSRLSELIIEATDGMEKYDMALAIRPFELFIEDLSTWYLRRSRERIKNDDAEAKQTLYFVLKTLAKIIAPFTPFSAEDIWQKLKNENEEESVHLCSWPEISKKKFDVKETEIILEMEQVRKIVTLGLQARQKVEIPVRQPLNRLEIICDRLDDKYFDIIKDEINVKEIKFSQGNELNIQIDTNITEELRIEGQYRELVRAIQEMRKKTGLTPSDKITLFVQTNDDGNKTVEKFENDIKKIVLASEIKYDVNDGEDIKIGSLVFKIQIVKK